MKFEVSSVVLNSKVIFFSLAYRSNNSFTSLISSIKLNFFLLSLNFELFIYEKSKISKIMFYSNKEFL